MIDISTKKGKIIHILPEVITFLSDHKQGKLFNTEIGGQLFGNICDKGILTIEKATQKHKRAKLSKFRYLPNRQEEQQEIQDMYAEGLNYFGDWHTHPEKKPNISWTDEKTIIDCFVKSDHSLDFFVHIIVGTEKWAIYIANTTGVEVLGSFDYRLGFSISGSY